MCLDPPKQATSIALLSEDLYELRKQQELIESQERLLSAVRQQMERYLLDHYGVDVVRETWELDLIDGVLRHGN